MTGSELMRADTRLEKYTKVTRRAQFVIGR